MSTHGRRFSLAGRPVPLDPKRLGDVPFTSAAVPFDPAAGGPSFFEAARLTPRQREDALKEMRGFRHMFVDEPSADQRFKVYGKSIDDVPIADVQTLMRRLAMRMNNGFEFKEPIEPCLEKEENPLIPSGYTYLLQLAGHDLMHSTSSLAIVKEHTAGVANGRMSALMLETIYGGGPDVTSTLYAKGAAGSQVFPDAAPTFLRLGRIRKRNAGETDQGCPFRDLARVRLHHTIDIPGNGNSACTVPLIADPRNDDHAILSQLTVLFHRLHNELMVRIIRDVPTTDPGRTIESAYDRFLAVRLAVTVIYRAILRHDLLEKILRPEVYQIYLKARKPLRDKWDRRIPIEFSHGAFRFGHAMIRFNYMIGNDTPKQTREALMLTSANAGTMPLDESWVVQWSRFFCFGGSPRNFSRRIAPGFTPALTDPAIFPPIDSPENVGGLAYRDLMSNALMRPWSVPALFGLLAKLEPLAQLLPDFRTRWTQPIRDWLDLQRGSGPDRLTDDDVCSLSEDPPLLFFVLFEAANEGKPVGTRLGTLGSILVAETFFGALEEGDQPFDGAADDSVKDALKHLATKILNAPHAFDFVPEIKSMPELIAFMAETLGLGAEQPPFV